MIRLLCLKLWDILSYKSILGLCPTHLQTYSTVQKSLTAPHFLRISFQAARLSLIF